MQPRIQRKIRQKTPDPAFICVRRITNYTAGSQFGKREVEYGHPRTRLRAEQEPCPRWAGWRAAGIKCAGESGITRKVRVTVKEGIVMLQVVKNESVASILSGAEKRLKRLGRRRKTQESKAAYSDAAKVIHALIRRRH